MENFFLDTDFFSDIDELLEHLEIEEGEVQDLPEDFFVEVIPGNLEPIFKLDIKLIREAIIEACEVAFEDRFPEDSPSVDKQIETAINQSVNVEKLNKCLPSLYYPEYGKTVKITKADILEYINS